MEETQSELPNVKYVDIAFNPTFYKGSNNSEVLRVVEEAKQEGVQLVFIGGTYKGCLDVYKLAYEYKCYCYVGIHPNDITTPTSTRQDLLKLEELLLQNDPEKRIIGIGECGLDTYRQYSSLPDQLEVLRWHFEIFCKYRLPFFFHLRNPDTHNHPVVTNNTASPSCDTAFIELVEEYKSQIVGGVVHSFTGSLGLADKLVNKYDLYIGLNGISFKQNIDVVRSVPLTKIMLETDSPFCLIRKSWAGSLFVNKVIRAKNNEPKFIVQICEAVSKVKDIEYKEVQEQTLANTRALFSRLK